MQFTSIFALLLAAFIVLVWVIYTEFFGSGYQPIPDKSARRMIELSKIKKKDVVVDLGCGDGKLLLLAAPLCKKAIGIEIDPLRFLIAKIRTARIKNIEVIFGNFFNFDLKEADVVLIFLRQHTNDKLKAKFTSELKRGSRVVSYVWKMNLKLLGKDEKLKVCAYTV